MSIGDRRTSMYPHVVSIISDMKMGIIQSKLMHYPVGFVTLWRLSGIINERLPVSNKRCLISDCITSFNNTFFIRDSLISSSGFPISTTRRSVRSSSVSILSVPRCEKVPFFFSMMTILSCSYKQIKIIFVITVSKLKHVYINIINTSIGLY